MSNIIHFPQNDRIVQLELLLTKSRKKFHDEMFYQVYALNKETIRLRTIWNGIKSNPDLFSSVLKSQYRFKSLSVLKKRVAKHYMNCRLVFDPTKPLKWNDRILVLVDFEFLWEFIACINRLEQQEVITVKSNKHLSIVKDEM